MSIATEITRLQQAKADLKTAINAKGRSITDETLDEYAAEVDLIVTGGGTEVPEEGTGEFLVSFYDYDGTLLKKHWVAYNGNATPPAVPDHSADCSGGGLTFQEWNNPYTSIKRDTDVGAVYVPTDGKTHLFFKIEVADDLNISTKIWNVSTAGTVTIDWGDGTTPEDYATSSEITISHNYASLGTYEVTIDHSVATGYMYFASSYLDYFLINHKKVLIRAHMSTKMHYQTENCITHQYKLSTISIPFISGLTGFSGFSGNLNLKAFIMPSNYRSAPYNIFNYCISLEKIIFNYYLNVRSSLKECRNIKTLVLPAYLEDGVSFVSLTGLEKIVTGIQAPYTLGQGIKNAFNLLEFITPPAGSYSSIGSDFFQYCYKLKKIKFSKHIASIGHRNFNSCYSLEELDFTANTSVPTMSNINNFSNTWSLKIIKVPLALEAEWKAATNWSTYASYIVGV